MSLVLVHPEALNKVSSLADGFSWFYADDSAAVDLSISGLFGEERRLLSPQAFQEKAALLRRDFLLWIDTALEGLPGESWIPASVFKDVFVTPMFLHALALVVIDEARKAGRDVVVVSASAALARQLQAYKRDVGIFGRRHFWQDSVAVRLKALRQCFWRPIRLAGAGFLARRIIGKKFSLRLRTVDVLVDTFLLDGDLGTGEVYRDRFLPGLFDYYRDQGCAAAALASTEAIKVDRLLAHYRAICQCETLVVPPEYLLRWWDILRGGRAVITALSVASRFRQLSFCGLDISILAATWWRISCLRTSVAMVLPRLAKRLSDVGAKPALVLIWFENQASDKALHLAFSQLTSKVNVIALHQYFPFSNIVNFFSTDGEVRHGVSARTHWVCGERMKLLFSAYDQLADYRVVPALRFDHLHRLEVTADGEDLVVFLTSNFEESLAILEIALADIGSTLGFFSSVVVKPHQALNINFQSLTQHRWPQINGRPLVWACEPSVELLKRAALVLTAGSSTALEAIGIGIPVVIVGRRAGLEVNPLEDVARDFWRTAYSAEQFEQLLKSWFIRLPPSATRQAFGRKLLASYFEPVTEAGMHVFLPEDWSTSNAKEANKSSAAT